MIDASGRTHTFIEKTAILVDDWGCEEHLKSYPRPGEIACTILDRRTDASGREIVTISTEKPWVIISAEDRTEFEVYSNQLTDIR
ncbi:MAG: hypothetical protein HOP17_17025 [Acidobacteria bacterium]|nr:hypothetical protein [Acidobacteriota bacterium]